MNWFRYIFVLSTLMILIQKLFKVNKILKKTKLNLPDVISFFLHVHVFFQADTEYRLNFINDTSSVHL